MPHSGGTSIARLTILVLAGLLVAAMVVETVATLFGTTVGINLEEAFRLVIAAISALATKMVIDARSDKTNGDGHE